MAPYYKLCVADHVDKIVSARATLKKKILRLAKRRANIICVSEIGYPAFLAKGDSKPGSTYQAFLAEGDYEFRLEIQQIADLYSVIIVCGSYHDPREFTNKAVIFFPGFSMPTEHLKMTSAMSIGEVIRTPTANQLPVYQTKLGNIAVLICKDAYDLNILLRYVTMGFHGMNEIRPDLILVPSFSPAPLEAACCDLSYFARCAVAYVNGDVEPHFAVFVGGEAIKVSTSSGVAFVKLNVAERDRMLVEAYEAQQVGVFSSVYGTFVGR